MSYGTLNAALSSSNSKNNNSNNSNDSSNNNNINNKMIIVIMTMMMMILLLLLLLLLLLFFYNYKKMASSTPLIAIRSTHFFSFFFFNFYITIGRLLLLMITTTTTTTSIIIARMSHRDHCSSERQRQKHSADKSHLISSKESAMTPSSFKNFLVISTYMETWTFILSQTAVSSVIEKFRTNIAETDTLLSGNEDENVKSWSQTDGRIDRHANVQTCG